MKTTLLLLGICVGVVGNAQTIELEDTISTGNSMTYYVLDSNATNLSEVVGAGSNWDYSTIGGYGLPGNTNNVIVASASEHAAQFPDAAYNENFENGVLTFLSNDAPGNRTIVHGFVFEEGTNTFIIKYDDDQLVSMTYPMNLGDTYTDDIEGSAVVPLGSPIDISGTATVTADGTGTLTVGTNSYTNVIRIYTKEVSSGASPVGGTVTFTRESYTYYDIDNFNMPIFIHGTVFADAGVLGDFGFTAVYSKDMITDYTGVKENELSNEINLTVFPNPVVGELATITTTAGTERLTILNAMGQTVVTLNNPETIEKINAGDLNTGVYFIQAQLGNALKTQKFVVK